MILPRKFGCWWIQAGVLTLLVSYSPACDLPVFRYALERWPASSYKVQIVSRGPLDHEAALARSSLVASTLLPVDSFDLNTGSNPPGLSPATELAITPSRPLLRLQLEHDAGGSLIVWEDKLTSGSVDLLVNSPGRREVVRRLMAGDSVVWLILKGADPAQNAEVIATVRGALNKAESEMQLPLPEGPGGGYTIPLTPSIPLKLSFSVLALAYKSPEAEFLRSLFRQTLPNCEMSSDGPVLAPVFGRGRVLDAMAGTAVSTNMVLGLCNYLVGNCSCEVKSLNPGADLFLPVNWRAVLGEATSGSNVLPELVVPVVEARKSGTDFPLVPSSRKSMVAPERPTLARRLLAASVIGLITVGVGAWVITRKGHSRL